MKRRPKRHVDVNVTSLVDVAFTLLIVFIIVTPMMASGIDVDLPETDATPIESTSDPLVLTITADGELFLNESTIASMDLKADIQKAIASVREVPALEVRADRATRYQQVMDALTEANKAGLTEISLITVARGRPR